MTSRHVLHVWSKIWKKHVQKLKKIWRTENSMISLVRQEFLKYFYSCFAWFKKSCLIRLTVMLVKIRMIRVEQWATARNVRDRESESKRERIRKRHKFGRDWMRIPNETEEGVWFSLHDNERFNCSFREIVMQKQSCDLNYKKCTHYCT